MLRDCLWLGISAVILLALRRQPPADGLRRFMGAIFACILILIACPGDGPLSSGINPQWTIRVLIALAMGVVTVACAAGRTDI